MILCQKKEDTYGEFVECVYPFAELPIYMDLLGLLDSH
jgi:hypothetical protein